MKISRPQINIGEVRIGRVPRIVGVVTTSETFSDRFEKQNFECDLVEMRLDLIGSNQNMWKEYAKRIEAGGQPIILTIRLETEDGQWTGLDQDRFCLFKEGLGVVSAIDVELRSRILPDIAQEARSLEKCTIVSYHDFDKTPPLVELQHLVQRGTKFGQIVKIATMIRSAEDVETLKNLLNHSFDVPICVIGMGDKGRNTRIIFPDLGSCLSYGYLDQPSAPGQLSARELRDLFRSHGNTRT